jgi:hypothetical protein
MVIKKDMKTQKAANPKVAKAAPKKKHKEEAQEVLYITRV